MAYLTSEEIACRLHKPVIDEFPNINMQFISILENQTDMENICIKDNSWLFLGTPVYKHIKKGRILKNDSIKQNLELNQSGKLLYYS